jgi:hypothetical protein
VVQRIGDRAGLLGARRRRRPASRRPPAPLFVSRSHVAFLSRRRRAQVTKLRLAALDARLRAHASVGDRRVKDATDAILYELLPDALGLLAPGELGDGCTVRGNGLLF